MNGLSIKVDIADAAEPRVGALIAGMEDRTDLHSLIAAKERDLIRDHFLALEQTRHDTAMRLGARPSGFWGMAANNTSASADGEAAKVSVTHPGVGRALHDVTITPNAPHQWLTIPLIAAAYNQRDQRVPGLFVLPGAAMPVLYKKNEDKTITPWYALVRSVTQKQDRSLLPSDEELREQALMGVREYIDDLLTEKGAA